MQQITNAKGGGREDQGNNRDGNPGQVQAFLLAEDKKITDSTITRQLKR